MRFQDNKITTFRAHFREQLKKKGMPDTEVDSIFKMLLEERLGIRPHQLAAEPDWRMSESEMLVLIDDLKQLKSGRPVQYILGLAYFRGRQFKVDQRALIPRQETEELVQWIAEDMRPNCRILDIGTGSGCIAISLALEDKSAVVSCIDSDSDALALCIENAQNLEADVQPICMDILIDFPKEKFDIIVSNPPYVLKSESQSMDKMVIDHEPHLALFVPDQDPLVFYRKIIQVGLEHLQPKGRLYFEINSTQGANCAALLADSGYIDIELKKDLNGKDRMIRAVVPNPD